MTILFVHGWGFGPDVWDGVRSHLGDLPTATVDLGYRGTPVVPAIDGPVMAVGHSLGFLWLLHRRVAARHMVAVNGFARFTADGDFPGVAPRVLERMIQRIEAAPAAVHGDFLRRCGVEAPDTDGFNPTALRDGLRALAEWDERANLGPVTALCGRQDPIVTEAMSRATFADIEWHDGGHMLPLTASEWVAEQLRRLAVPA